jgi:hypothetical protein
LDEGKVVFIQMGSMAGSGQMERWGGNTENQGRLIKATWSVTSSYKYHSRHIKYIYDAWIAAYCQNNEKGW